MRRIGSTITAKYAEITLYIYQRKEWPHFRWDSDGLAEQLTKTRHDQGRLLGRMDALGFGLRSEASFESLTQDVLKTSEIEGEILDRAQVRSSLARRLGVIVAGLKPADRHVDGIVEMTLDATQNYAARLTKDRLFAWHTALFPQERDSVVKIAAGKWRTKRSGPMQVVSGPIGRQRIHFEAPDAGEIEKGMRAFLDWFNNGKGIDPVLKAGIAHLWFVTIHPFEDGNGRIARAIADLMLARSENMAQRFYSMSAQIRDERKAYYDILEATQKGGVDITAWLEWFLACLGRAFVGADAILETVLAKARFWKVHVATPLNERQRMMINRLLDGFDGKLTSSKWAKIAKCSQDSALRDIEDLRSRKILSRDEAGGRSTSYSLVVPVAT